MGRNAPRNGFLPWLCGPISQGMLGIVRLGDQNATEIRAIRREPARFVRGRKTGQGTRFFVISSRRARIVHASGVVPAIACLLFSSSAFCPCCRSRLITPRISRCALDREAMKRVSRDSASRFWWSPSLRLPGQRTRHRPKENLRDPLTPAMGLCSLDFCVRLESPKSRVRLC